MNALNIHEYQGKRLFREHGVAVQQGVHCTTAEQAGEAWDSLGCDIVAVKAQIHAGGRGKGSLFDPDSGEMVMQGGVKIVRSRDEVLEQAANILGNRLVTKQTGAAGKIVKNLYVEAGCDIAHEFYLAILVDREERLPLIMASREGGMDIEEVAASNPDAIHKMHFDASIGPSWDEGHVLGSALGLEDEALQSFQLMLAPLADMFIVADCSMVEINPLVLTGDDRIVALDAKVSFDDNAAFRHPEYAELRDLSEEEPTEVRAKEAGLSYVKLDGDIGCLVNGAGLAMATMDVIKLYGGEPANFLDVGGAATEEAVKTAFEIILEDPNVKGIMVNIFGGIVRCDIVARGIIGATAALGLEDPLVVRLAGTNFEEGRRLLDDSGLNIHSAETLAEGAQKIVELAGGDS